ncbi:MAG: PLP-dependent aminotransferase family protein [bacterium]|nr:PLP-dependent aminotransferase family protein [bacterium]
MLEIPINLREDAREPLYQQLYRALSGQIVSRRLASGTRMPGKRTLASQLAVSVNTVDAAYQMLCAEGYLESRARSGYFVQELPEIFPAAPREEHAPVPEPPRAWAYDCSTGNVDTALFPLRTWGRIQRELLYNDPELLLHSERQGDLNLREAILDYLRAYRGVRCGCEQMVVGAGVEYLLGLAAQLLAGSVAAVEEPGYGRSRTILENSGIRCRHVPLDAHGLRADALEESGANLCYVTPSHHFPTAVTMPVGRRAQLLQWSQQPQRYILEDDYDAEFRFDMRPVPSLQGMAGPDGRVIYLCTFSKSLAPGIRIACMVLPRELVPEYQRMFGSYSNTVSRVEQQTLRSFMAGGHFTRHLSRMRLVYQRKMRMLCAALEEAFGEDSIALQGRHTGLHLMLTLHDGPGEQRMVEAARAAGVRLSGLSEYYHGANPQCPENTVILGYAALREDQLAPLAQTLKSVWTMRR